MSATLTHLMPNTSDLRIGPLGFPWKTIAPFLFCAHHDDANPRGNAKLGPDANLSGRDIGQNFSRNEGWSMYHGQTVPGFPAYPHRGFETVTIVRKGLIDHSDSLGARARFGRGDVQWLTAGKGVVHSEMLPLLKPDEANPLELFQIWLNLPARHKMVEPHFTILWSEDIPRQVITDAHGRLTEVAVVAGRLHAPQADFSDVTPLPPPPDSWAAQADADVAIWTIRLSPGARWTLPAAAGEQTQCSLYFFKGSEIGVGGQKLSQHAAIEVRTDPALDLENLSAEFDAEFLLLQGRPIGEAVAQYGPFVMNTKTEIPQAIADYQRTQFGGWP